MTIYHLKYTRTGDVTTTESPHVAGALIAAGHYQLISQAKFDAALKRLAVKKKREAEKPATEQKRKSRQKS